MAQDSKLWQEALIASKKYVVPQTNKSYKVKKRRVSYWETSTIAGADDIRLRLKEINNHIKELKAEKKQLVSRLKPWIIEYEKKPYQLYALQLNDSCWYIGISRNPDRRFAKHAKGKGANWTRLHKAIQIYETRTTTALIENEAVKLEDDMTLEYALKYGSEFVRGGGYCQTKPRWPDMIIQNEKPF